MSIANYPEQNTVIDRKATRKIPRIDLYSLALTLLVGIGRILAEDKLLYQGIGEPAPGVDGRAGENQAWPAIARRIVEVCKGARDQIAAYT
jgi:hypothetical protein